MSLENSEEFLECDTPESSEEENLSGISSLEDNDIGEPPKKKRKVTQVAQALGNTCTRARRARSWCFTINNHKDDTGDTLDQAFRDNNAKRWVFQEEVAPTTNTPHLQGCVMFANARTFNSLKNSIFPKEVHLEITRGTWKSNVAYCSKASSRVEGGRSWRFGVPEEVRDPLAGKKLRPWQSEIKGIIDSKPDDRTILWVADLEGNSGKTTFCKSLLVDSGEHQKYAYVSGKAIDVKHAVAQIVENHNLSCVFFDFVRSKEEYVSYEAIEAVKNGIFFSSKYESKTVVFNCPHLVVFANFYPDEEKLSKDRWKIYSIDEHFNLILK